MSELHDAVHAFADGELPPHEAEAFRLHLGTCARCQVELGEILQLQVLEARLGEEEARARPPPMHAVRARAFRPAWNQRRGLFAAALGGAVAALMGLSLLNPSFGFLRETGGSEPLALALTPTRMLEARLTWPGAAGHRPYSVPRSSGGHLGEPVPLRALATLEEAGDFQGVAAGRLLRGEVVEASQAFQRAPASADVDSDKAALALVEGEPEQALGLLEGVLRTHPRHAQALWNRCLALRDLRLTRASATCFRAVSALNEPGWSDESRTRAESLERQAQEWHREVRRERDTGSASHQEGTRLESELAKARTLLDEGHAEEAMGLLQALRPRALTALEGARGEGDAAQEASLLRALGEEARLRGATSLSQAFLREWELCTSRG